MGRIKEFDRNQALLQAMFTFWEQGYAATSTDDLLRAMDIGRQSMYDTFGDKHGLYLEALRRYLAEYSLVTAYSLTVTESPLATMESVLMAIAHQTPEERARGCMGINATSELAHCDDEVASMLKSSGTACAALLAEVVYAAKLAGEIESTVDERQAARFVLSTLNGLRVSAKAGASPDELRGVVEMAMRSLKGH